MSLNGHLEIICQPDANGRSVLRHQSFAAPIHLSKPHWDGETLLVNVVNPTAGLFIGDSIRCDVNVKSGGRLLLTSPSASRAHTMPADKSGEARLDQTFTVASGARLEVWPELFIPQRGCRYRQTTRAQIEAGGQFLLFETLAPGRVASGEAFEYDRLTWDTEIFYEGKLAVLERYTATPQSPSILAMRVRFPTGYYASGFAISPALTKDSACWEALERLHSDDVWVGFSALSGNAGWAIKVLAAGSVALRKTISSIRNGLYASMGQPVPGLRRV